MKLKNGYKGLRNMNRKGDITIAILVIGIVVVCFIAIISFYLADLDTDNNFENIGKMSVISSTMEKYASNVEGIREEVKDELIENRYFNIAVIDPEGFRAGSKGLEYTSEKVLFNITYYVP